MVRPFKRTRFIKSKNKKTWPYYDIKELGYSQGYETVYYVWDKGYTRRTDLDLIDWLYTLGYSEKQIAKLMDIIEKLKPLSAKKKVILKPYKLIEKYRNKPKGVIMVLGIIAKNVEKVKKMSREQFKRYVERLIEKYLK